MIFLGENIARCWGLMLASHEHYLSSKVAEQNIYSWNKILVAERGLLSSLIANCSLLLMPCWLMLVMNWFSSLMLPLPHVILPSLPVLEPTSHRQKYLYTGSLIKISPLTLNVVQFVSEMWNELVQIMHTVKRTLKKSM